MPYIAQEDRKNLDPAIDELARRIVLRAKKDKNDGAFAGLLNYSITRLTLKVARTLFGRMRYWVIATVTGVLKNVSQEFYRRVAAPYEDKKIKEHGDVDLYEEFTKEIESE